MECKLNYNYEEFSTFLLIHASYADLEFTEDEVEKIKKRISTTNFEQIHDDYKKLNDGEVLQVILGYKGIHYPTVARKMELLSLIREQFSADGEFSKLEQGMMRFLERIL